MKEIREKETEFTKEFVSTWADVFGSWRLLVTVASVQGHQDKATEDKQRCSGHCHSQEKGRQFNF